MRDHTYILKHKNINVALFKVEDVDNILDMRLSKKNEVHLPLGCKDIASVKQWIKRRSIPLTRDSISRDLENINLFQYMLVNMGLSLTDHYWICPVDSGHTWESINAYSNDFKSAYSLDLHDDEAPSIAGQTNFLPSASLNGDLKKKWVIDKNGKRILVKGNYSSGCLQSISEVFASQIHKAQGFQDYVSYQLIDISSNGEVLKGCACSNFTDLQSEFLPAYDIVSSKKKANHMSYFEHYINVSVTLGIDHDILRSFMDYQIMTDFIITNTDRHFNNFGIMRDSQTLKLTGPAPIFDTGNSLFYRSSYVPVGKSLLDIEVTSFLKKEVDLLKYVTDRRVLDITSLPSGDHLYELLSIDTGTTEEKRERIVKAYLKKIEYLIEFQNGKDIWQRT